jgi:hypothetical protein
MGPMSGASLRGSVVMMLPIAAPARMPAPTAQPMQSACAGDGATTAAQPMPATPTSMMSDLCNVFSLARPESSRDAASPRTRRPTLRDKAYVALTEL